MKNQRKPFTVYVYFKDEKSDDILIRHATGCVTTNQGTIEICTEDDTFIFPIDNLQYVRLVKE